MDGFFCCFYLPRKSDIVKLCLFAIRCIILSFQMIFGSLVSYPSPLVFFVLRFDFPTNPSPFALLISFLLPSAVDSKAGRFLIPYLSTYSLLSPPVLSSRNVPFVLFSFFPCIRFFWLSISSWHSFIGSFFVPCVYIWNFPSRFALIMIHVEGILGIDSERHSLKLPTWFDSVVQLVMTRFDLAEKHLMYVKSPIRFVGTFLF